MTCERAVSSTDFRWPEQERLLGELFVFADPRINELLEFCPSVWLDITAQLLNRRAMTWTFA